MGQEIVDLVKSQVALLPPELDETLKVFPFVLLLHAPKLPYQPASPPAGLRQRVPSMRRQQIFSDDTEIAPGIGAKNRRIGHRDGPFQEPALVIQDEVFGRHNKVLRSEPLCRLNSDAKTLKSSARARASGEPVRHQFAP